MDQGNGVLVDQFGPERRHLQGRVAGGHALQQRAALRMARFDSQGKADYAAKVLAMMRKGFGGHPLGKPR